ncbi:porin [Paraburkholderia sp.]|uniref:porin n=1 Tax=Paraburkholderia sp. TaxID=1926495 RepID=UPI003C7BF3A1
MKKLAYVAVAVGSCGVASFAQAQNSVTLYGLIDTSVAYIHNDGGKNAALMLGGNTAGPRWGLKGSEDLGGGLKTVFQLENGFSSTNGSLGQGGAEFGRQAFVGLTSNLGTVTAGRQYVPDTDLVQGITGDGYGAIFPTPGDVDNYDNDVRVSNALKYASPVLAGLQGEVMYAFGNRAGSVGSGRAWGAALAYTAGPLALASSYQFYDGGAVTSGVRTYTGAADSIFNSIVNAGYSSAKSVKIARVAGQYTIGPVVTGVSFSNSQYSNDAASVFTTTQKYNSVAAFGAYSFTPAFTTAVGYSYTKSSGDSSAKYNQVSFGADYSISKRTDLYLVGAWQRASGSVRAADGSGIVAAQASIGSYGFNGANQGTQEYAALGIRHRF